MSAFMTPAQRHKARALAVKAATAERERLDKAEGSPSATAGSDPTGKHALLMVELHNEIEVMRQLPQGKARNARKHELLSTYLPLVQDYVDSGSTYPNEMISLLMVWCFDVGDIDKALELADIAMAGNHPVHERFKSNLKTLISDNFLEWAKSAKAEGVDITGHLDEMIEKVLGWEIHEEIQLKYLREGAKSAVERKEFAKALEYVKRAEELNPAEAQVVTVKKQAEKGLAAQPTAKPAKAPAKAATKAKTK